MHLAPSRFIGPTLKPAPLWGVGGSHAEPVGDEGACTYTPEWADVWARKVGVWWCDGQPLPEWLADHRTTYVQWVASRPLQGPTGAQTPIPDTHLASVWRAWLYRRATLQAWWLVETRGMSYADALAQARGAVERVSDTP